MLMNSIAESARNKDFGADAIRHMGVVAARMCDAIVAILCSVGLRAFPADDEMRPFAVRVEE